jgi:hypothetical protein
MPQHWRHFWGPQGGNIFNFEWDIIQHDSFVVITAGEGPGFGASDFPPERFVGNAAMMVGGVAPHTGGVTFWMLIEDGTHNGAGWEGGLLNVWTDITVFDATDPSGQN